MEVNNINSSQMANQAAANSKSQISINDFLKIMAAEIQNQNPMGDSSGSKADYLSQLAQFTTLEQMNSIAEGISQLSILSQSTLIGKMVKIYGPAEDITGVVSKVKFFNNQAYLQVNGTDYPIGLLMEISDVPRSEERPEIVENPPEEEQGVIEDELQD
ncbi:MAG: flagellar hook capping FlgD N-terminal domain-containing protein [Gudongella sp.]|jgi:flagellar basal-body rod modification protein FlgD|nr:flagellar hook capping FlgD N-terminal domain-containing protein [Gudongella sp.]